MMHAPSNMLRYAFARERGVLLETQDGQPVLLHRPGVDLDSLLEVRRVAGRSLPLHEMPEAEFDARLAQAYAQTDLGSAAATAMDTPDNLHALADGLPQTADLLASDDDAPVIQLINGILQEALRARASDIHIEPYETRLTVRFRIDGVLRDMLELSPKLTPLVTSRIKVMAELDIARKQTPQDGRFSFRVGSRAVDVRVSTLPAQHGERVVMRILEKDSGHLSLSQLGMGAAQVEIFQQMLAQPNGMVLVTGPTGSGKTTTLYAALRHLHDGSRNILTVEDPIEYALDGIGQTQVNRGVGMEFATGLRAILRQDPDVVMVGEIRDPETAEIAVQAAMTGHLVLSTVHTNSALAAIARLRDLGVEPFLLSTSLTGILAQRLVRRLCPNCRKEISPDPALAGQAGLPDWPKGARMYEPAGCDVCRNTGYSGRLGLYELVPVNDALRQAIHKEASDAELETAGLKAGQSLLEQGVARVLAGETSLAEVLRVCRSARAEGE